MNAAELGAAVPGPALPRPPGRVDRDLPGVAGHLGDRNALPLAQLPAHRVGQLPAGPGRQLVQAGDQAVTGPGPIDGDHQPPPIFRRYRGDRGVQHLDVVAAGVRPGAARAHHPAQRLAGIVAIGQKRVVAEPFEVRLGALLV